MSHVSASFSATIRVRLTDSPGSFGRLAQAVGEAGGSLGAIDLVRVEKATKVRDVTVDASDAEHLDRGEVAAIVLVLAEDRLPADLVRERVHRLALAHAGDVQQLARADVLGPEIVNLLHRARQFRDRDEHRDLAIRFQLRVNLNRTGREPLGGVEAADIFLDDGFVVWLSDVGVHEADDLFGCMHAVVNRHDGGDRFPNWGIGGPRPMDHPERGKRKHEGNRPGSVAANDHRASPWSQARLRRQHLGASRGPYGRADFVSRSRTPLPSRFPTSSGFASPPKLRQRLAAANLVKVERLHGR